MKSDAVDFPALALAILVTLAITLALGLVDRQNNRKRSWLAAAGLAAALAALGTIELLTHTPRETHIATVAFGATVPVAGALGLIRATRPLRPWFRWPLVVLVTFALLFVGLLFGAAMVPKYFS